MLVPCRTYAITQEAPRDRAQMLQPRRLRQFVKQRLCLLQIGGVEPLREPAIDGGEEVVGFGGLALGVPETGEAGCCTQLQCPYQTKFRQRAG